tara:strand:+ start:4304 stop:4522 length:219 start_codon:yes stop_codon:yes gene_type:complete
MKVKCEECGVSMRAVTAYRCRICKDYYCDECSLLHFGLKEADGKVTYKNIFTTILWVIKKRLGLVENKCTKC